MKLYLVQHGAACAKEADPLRPLTEQGETDIARLAAFLKRAGVRASRVMHSGKLRAFETYGQLLIEREQAAALRRTYESIKEQAGQLATQMEIDLVMLNDSIPTVDLSDAAGTLQQISARRILWASQTLDITDQLLEKMNGT